MAKPIRLRELSLCNRVCGTRYAGNWPEKAFRTWDFGRGGGDRKLNPLSQVLSCQRRSTAALLPIGVKWCQIPRTAHDRSVLAISTRSDWTLPVMHEPPRWAVM